MSYCHDLSIGIKNQNPPEKNKNYRKAKKPKGESLTKNAKAQLQPELGKNQGTAGLYEINKKMNK